MKWKLAAIAAAFLIFSACSAKPATVSYDEEPEENFVVSSSEEAIPANPEAEPSADIQEETKPTEPEAHFAEDFTDEPYDVQSDIEEIVSVSLTLPHFTLDTSAEAVEQINAAFETLKDNLNHYASTTVYETAQARSTIGFIEGSYTASLSDGILLVTYSVDERYADDENVTTYENTYRFDTATGKQLEQ